MKPSEFPQLCIVVPAHNEEQNLPVLHAELSAVLGAEGIDFELLLVDDGSRDGTAKVIRELGARHANVRGLVLSRNFGHQAAVCAGLQHARGRAVAVMDADLQDRPADVVALYRAWQDGADVAYAVRRTRREHLLKRIAYRAFYRVFARLANIPIQLDSGDFCVMDGQFVERLNALPERLRFVRGLRAWLGGTQVAVFVDRDTRRSGVPQYTLVKLVRLALDGIVSFSDTPLRVASVAGIALSGLAFVGAGVVLLWHFLGLMPRGAGLATIALSVLFLGGLQLLGIGILGEYVGRIFLEVKRRPTAIVGEVVSGRTELRQDALPIALGTDMSEWTAPLRRPIERSAHHLTDSAIALPVSVDLGQSARPQG